MGDAGEGLVDAEARIQERMEERERERAERTHVPRDPEAARELETLRLGRVELERQLTSTTHDRRRAMLQQAIADLDRRMAALRERLS
jgi:hypothetical protein